MQKPPPPHNPEDVSPAYQLRYTWTGWPTYDETLPPEPTKSFFVQYANALEGDGIRLLERRWSATHVQLTASVTPDVTPIYFAQRIRGRLDYACRGADITANFKRKPTVSCIGEAHRQDVEAYIDNQVSARNYVSEAFANRMLSFTTKDGSVDLSKPHRTRRGTYWYGLHLVLAMSKGERETSDERLRRIRDLCTGVASKHGHRLRNLSVLPDHLHIAVSPPPSVSPKHVGMCYLNNLCHATSATWWNGSFYVGTFGEYDMDAIRDHRA